MSSPKIAIIDYGAGNLRSVAKALESLGHPARVTGDPSEVDGADAVILPGVGAAGDTMSSLAARGMVEVIHRAVAQGKPFFGVCLGLQLLFESTEEGGAECLGLLPGRVRRLPNRVKVPHIGWNQVTLKGSHPLFDGIVSGSNFYFVHSYYADPTEQELVAGQTEHGAVFCSAIVRGNLVATQFHPEKSGALGLKLYQNFVHLMVGAPR